MHTLSNAYLRKSSSGLVLALLAVSGFLFLVPAIAPVHADTISTPTFKFYPGSLQYGAEASSAYKGLNFNLTNPSSNTVGISQLQIYAPAGFAFVNYPLDSHYGCYGGIFGPTVDSGDGCLTTSSVATFGTSVGNSPSGVALGPGGTTLLSAGLYTVPTSATYPHSYTFTSSWTDTLGASHAGPSFTFNVFDPSATTPSMMASKSEAVLGAYPAGSGSFTLTSNIGVANAGVYVTFFDDGSNYGAFSGSGITCYDAGTMCYVATNSAGTASISYTPSNTIGSTTVYSIYGNSPACPDYPGPSCHVSGDQYWERNSTTVTVVAGAPTKATITLPNSTATTAPNHYEDQMTTDPAGKAGAVTAGAGITVALADKFGNPVNLATYPITSMTISATSGGGRFNNGTTTDHTSIMCSSQFTCPVANSFALSAIDGGVNYYQSTAYGSVGAISVSISGTGFNPVYGQSGSIITSSYDLASPVPLLSPSTDSGDTNNIQAGNSVQVSINTSASATVGNTGVPVWFYLDPASTSVNADGTMSATATSGSNGNASATFKVDTGAGAISQYTAAIAHPIDGNPTNVLVNSTSGSSTAITTVAGPASTFMVTVFFGAGLTNPTADVIPSTTYNVDVWLVDAYGNTGAVAGSQIQIALSASSGVLTATNVYISPGHQDTGTSFGTIYWTSPSTTGSVTLTATGVVSGHSKTGSESVSVLTKTPSITVQSPAPLSGVIYSSTPAVLFSGVANSSLGYFTNTTIASVGYKIGSGAWQSASITPANHLAWQAAVVLPSGISTVSFNATDSNTNTVVSQSYTVLVDTSGIDVNFGTADNANLSSPATVTASLVDPMGDLNASSVSAVATNVDTSATATLTATVTGANNVGHSVTYGVSLSGLTTGNWSISLSASDLAGNTNSSALTVHVTVPFAQSFVVSGTPSTTTLGSFTGISATYSNLNPTSQNVVIFAVFKNSGGQTMGIGTGSATFGAGSTQTVFIANPVGLASGTYTVSIFVFTTGNLPVSVTTTISVTV